MCELNIRHCYLAYLSLDNDEDTTYLWHMNGWESIHRPAFGQ